MSFGNDGKLHAIGWLLRNTVPMTISSQLIALWNGNPGSFLVTGTEVAGNNYSRVPTGPGDWLEPSSGTATNGSAIVFPECQTADWGLVDYIVICNQVGFPLFYGPLTTAKTITVGSIPRFDVGDLVVTLV